MRNLIALAYFLFALLGCDTGGSTLITRTIVDGQDSLNSRTRLQAGIGRFECLASASGRCHYALFEQTCAPGQADCRDQPFERFSLDAGASREIVGLPERIDLCVTQDAAPATLKPDCKLPAPAAERAAPVAATAEQAA